MEKAISLSREQLISNYCIQGDAFRELEQWSKAISAYNEAMALEQDPHIYYLLARVQGLQGDIEGAITTYQQLLELEPETESSVGENIADVLRQNQSVYQSIWNALQKKKTHLDPRRFCYPEIEAETEIEGKIKVKEYFTAHSQYGTIDLAALTPKDKSLLESYHLSTNNLLSCKNSQGISRYLELVEPWNGTRIKSNKAFCLQPFHPLVIYRFEGEQIFYLLVEEKGYKPLAVYFPQWELLVKLNQIATEDLIEAVNCWKSYAVNHWVQIMEYIAVDS